MTRILAAVSRFFGGKIGNGSGSVGIFDSATEQSQPSVTILNAVGNDWRCWRLAREADREFAFRLALHLQTLAIAIEDDLERVLAVEREIQHRRRDNE